MGIFQLNDTICALSTAPGMGAIAVIRLSGPAAFKTTGEIFKPAEKDFGIHSVKSHTIHLGVIGMESRISFKIINLLYKD